MNRPGSHSSGGFTLIEALVALLLLGAVLHLCWGVAAAQARSLRAMIHRSDVLGAERAVWWVLTTETGAGVGGRDWSLAGDDVLALRAFRGRGITCGKPVDPKGGVEVRYRGWRVPDPAKDSVLTLGSDGAWIARNLAGRDPGSCPARDGERAERWRLEPVPAEPIVMGRVFERGSYHLQDEAFRYRRGQGGRQPITPEVLDPAGSGIGAGPASVVQVRFRGAGHAGRDTGWTRALSGG